MRSIPILLLLILSLFGVQFCIPYVYANTNLQDFADIKAKQVYIVDIDTHTVLYEKNSEMAMTPSSMTKLMTLYIIFSKLKSGSISLDTQCYASKEATMIGGSTMFLKHGQKVSILELLNGVVIVSGNDAAHTLAECTSGSLNIFASEMNEVAKILGIYNSKFKNPTGWPVKGHYMTAKDIAILSEALYRDFPEYYYLFSQKSFTFNEITQRATNDLLFKDLNIRGIKTGKTEDGGYGISALSHDENGRNILIVVNGLSSKKERVDTVEKFIRYSFYNFSNVSLFNIGEHVFDLSILNGTKTSIPIIADKVINFTYKNLLKDNVTIYLKYNDNLQAPIKIGDVVGTVEIHNSENEINTFLLTSSDNIPRISSIKVFFRKLFRKRY